MKSAIVLPNLASSLGMSYARLVAFLKDNGLEHLIGRRSLGQDDILSVLEVYKRCFGLERSVWPLPDWLANAENAWGHVLVDMYHDPISFPSSLPPSQGRLIYDLIVQAHPSVVVEIGCFIGISSIWIGAALQHLGRGHLYAIDTFVEKYPAPPWRLSFLENPLDYATNSVARAGLGDYVDFFRMRSRRFGEKLNGYIQEEVDFLFIDGDHSIGGCLDDFATFLPYVKEGGAILLHDTNPRDCGWKGPRYLMDMLMRYPSCFKVTPIETEPNYGMALITLLEKTKAADAWRDVRVEVLRQYHHARNSLSNSRIYRDILRPFLLRHNCLPR